MRVKNRQCTARVQVKSLAEQNTGTQLKPTERNARNASFCVLFDPTGDALKVRKQLRRERNGRL